MSELNGDRLAGKATLEGMPVEIQVDIMRQLLKTPYTIELYPQDTHASISWGFGSLGILSVSKHFSAIGLSVLYGENEFSIPGYEYTLAEHDHMEKYEWARQSHNYSFQTNFERLI